MVTFYQHLRNSGSKPRGTTNNTEQLLVDCMGQPKSKSTGKYPYYNSMATTRRGNPAFFNNRPHVQVGWSRLNMIQKHSWRYFNVSCPPNCQIGGFTTKNEPSILQFPAKSEGNGGHSLDIYIYYNII